MPSVRLLPLQKMPTPPEISLIVGSIAEALWGIPEWIKEKALSYLPQDMKDVVMEFYKRLNRLRKLTKK